MRVYVRYNFWGQEVSWLELLCVSITMGEAHHVKFRFI